MISRRRPWSGQRQIEKLDQAGQFRRHLDGGSGQDQRPSIGGKFLADIAQPAHDHRIIHVAMEVFEDEHSLDRHGLEVRERLHGIGGVVDRRLADASSTRDRTHAAPATIRSADRHCRCLRTRLPERTRPSAMVHSKTARLRSEQALRTRVSARTSSTVSMTTIGVEELIRTFRRSSGLLFGSISI